MTEDSCPVGIDTKNHVISYCCCFKDSFLETRKKKLVISSLWPLDFRDGGSTCLKTYIQAHLSAKPLIMPYMHLTLPISQVGFPFSLPKERLYQQVLTVTTLGTLLSLLSSSFPILLSSIICSIVKRQLQDKFPIVLNFYQHPLKYS